MSSLSIKGTEFVLPSGGLFYSEDLGLNQKDTVVIRPMIAADTKVLAGMGGDSYRIYRNLLSRLVVKPEKLDLDKLLLSDCNAILYAVRVISYGNLYHFTSRCPSCDTQGEYATDFINDLECVYHYEKDDFKHENECTLNRSKDVIRFKLPTLETEATIDRHIKTIKKRGTTINSVDLEKSFVKLAVLITAINGEEVVWSVAHEYVNNLNLTDFDQLSEAINDADTGIRTDINITCKNCGWEEDTALTLTAEFFRPQSRRGK